jgi:diaminopimelate epimerase
MQVFLGHGTENDFVVVPDLDGRLELTGALVRALCDRRAGLGADGVLRAVRTEHAPGEIRAASAAAPYFMDYRNADGSLAEMCGNGIRLFVRYLQRAGLVGDATTVATRGGARHVARAGDGTGLSVTMGAPRICADRPVVTAGPIGARRATALRLPNPHAVVALDSIEQLDALELADPPLVQPAGPDGQNVEFVHRAGPRELAMRVYERGVGETRSCGTGICAAVVAAALADGSARDGQRWSVDVPGGRCSVCWRADDELVLSGPAIIVAEADVDEEWLAAAAYAPVSAAS